MRWTLSRPHLRLHARICAATILLCLVTAVFGRQVSEDEEELQQLRDAARRASGVLTQWRAAKPSEAALANALKHTLLVVVATHHYAALLHNWLCHVRRTGLRPLVVALDEELERHVLDQIPSVVVHRARLAPAVFDRREMRSRNEQQKGMGANANPTWVSRRGRNRVLHTKVRLVRMLLEIGYDVWLSDADIGFAHSPLLRSAHSGLGSMGSVDVDPAAVFRRDSHLEFQEEHVYLFTTRDPQHAARHQGNTGFFLARRHLVADKSEIGDGMTQAVLSPTIALFRAVEAACARRPDDDDQTVLFETLWTWAREGHNVTWVPHDGEFDDSDNVPITQKQVMLRLRSLSPLTHATGHSLKPAERIRYLHEVRKKGLQPIIAHANHIYGDDGRQRALAMAGMWLFRGFRTETRANTGKDTNWTQVEGRELLCAPFNGSFIAGGRNIVEDLDHALSVATTGSLPSTLNAVEGEEGRTGARGPEPVADVVARADIEVVGQVCTGKDAGKCDRIRVPIRADNITVKVHVHALTVDGSSPAMEGGDFVMWRLQQAEVCVRLQQVSKDRTLSHVYSTCDHISVVERTLITKALNEDISLSGAQLLLQAWVREQQWRRLSDVTRKELVWGPSLTVRQASAHISGIRSFDVPPVTTTAQTAPKALGDIVSLNELSSYFIDANDDMLCDDDDKDGEDIEEDKSEEFDEDDPQASLQNSQMSRTASQSRVRMIRMSAPRRPRKLGDVMHLGRRHQIARRPGHKHNDVHVSAIQENFTSEVRSSTLRSKAQISLCSVLRLVSSPALAPPPVPALYSKPSGSQLPQYVTYQPLVGRRRVVTTPRQAGGRLHVAAKPNINDSSMHRIAIVSVATDEVDEYARHTMANHAMYAQRHGYAYYGYRSVSALLHTWGLRKGQQRKADTETADGALKAMRAPGGGNARHSCWAKVLALLRHIDGTNSSERDTGNAYVLWIDADAIFTDVSRPISDFIRENQERQRSLGMDAPDLMVCDHSHHARHTEAKLVRWHFNSGFMLYRNSAWARALLLRVWASQPPHDYSLRGDQPAIITEIAREVDPPRKGGGCPAQRPDWRDVMRSNASSAMDTFSNANIFGYCARQHPRVSISDGLSCNAMHSIWREVRAKGATPWVLHAMGLFPIERTRALSAVNADLGIAALPFRLELDQE